MQDPSLKKTKAHELAMLLSEGRKKFILRLEPDSELQTHQGILRHNDLIEVPWGSVVRSHLGIEFYILEPSLHDMLLQIRRRSQIIFPKDIGYILLRLSVGPGKTVIEAGTGSGALTTALAWAVGPGGGVITYDRRRDMLELAQANLRLVGLEDRVLFRQKDISDGFESRAADALFLDLPNPEAYLGQARGALINGGTFGAILPTVNQVSELLTALRQHQFALIDVCEILLRFYKPVSARLRPSDRMVAHTGYLAFARPVLDDSRKTPSESA